MKNQDLYFWSPRLIEIEQLELDFINNVLCSSYFHLQKSFDRQFEESSWFIFHTKKQLSYENHITTGRLATLEMVKAMTKNKVKSIFFFVRNV